MGLFKLEIHDDTQSFITGIVNRVCASVDLMTNTIRDKKIDAKGSFEIKGG